MVSSRWYSSAIFVLLSAAWLWAVPAIAQTVDLTKDITKTSSLFSVEFRDADIKDVLRAVGQAANLNMIVSDSVTGQVSLSLKNVDIMDALESILKTKGLTYVRERNIVRVVAVADAKDDDMETRVFPLGYANGKDALGVVEKIKSEKAKVSVDTRINALVVRDLSLNIDRMERLLTDLDKRAPQIMIEAKIVEVSTNYAREFGVQWGGQYSGTNNSGTTVISGGVTGAGQPTGSGTFFPLTGDIGASGSPYIVNLPAAVGAGSGGALGISFGKLGGALSLDLQLSAMQATGNGKILSSPKLLTLNNKEARISSGTDIPVRTISSTANTGEGSTNTASVQIISASLLLSAIPSITNDNRIVMVIKVEKSEPDYTRVVDGIPTITKRNANTELVVNDGETVVLGGILTKNEGISESGVPFLSEIPLLGWLFRKKSKFENQAELMIFITPTIVLN